MRHANNYRLIRTWWRMNLVQKLHEMISTEDLILGESGANLIGHPLFDEPNSGIHPNLQLLQLLVGGVHLEEGKGVRLEVDLLRELIPQRSGIFGGESCKNRLPLLRIPSVSKNFEGIENCLRIIRESIEDLRNCKLALDGHRSTLARKSKQTNTNVRET